MVGVMAEAEASIGQNMLLLQTVPQLARFAPSPPPLSQLKVLPFIQIPSFQARGIFLAKTTPPQFSCAPAHLTFLLGYQMPFNSLCRSQTCDLPLPTQHFPSVFFSIQLHPPPHCFRKTLWAVVSVRTILYLQCPASYLPVGQVNK